MTAAVTGDEFADICQVLTSYGHAIDNADWGLFTEILDPRFVLEAGSTVFGSPDALRRNIESVEALPAHHIGIPLLIRLGADVVRAWSKFHVVSADGTTRSGDYIDILTRTGDRWRLAHREVWRRYDVAVDPDRSSQKRITLELARTAPIPSTLEAP